MGLSKPRYTNLDNKRKRHRETTMKHHAHATSNIGVSMRIKLGMVYHGEARLVSAGLHKITLSSDISLEKCAYFSSHGSTTTNYRKYKRVTTHAYIHEARGRQSGSASSARYSNDGSAE